LEHNPLGKRKRTRPIGNKKVLNRRRGRMTGKEAARLFFDDIMGNETHRPPEEIKKIIGSLSREEDARDFSKYARVGDKIASEMMVLRVLKGNIAEQLLKLVIRMIEVTTLVENFTRETRTPKIMTAKQFKDEKIKQRQEKLDKPVSLADLIIDFAEDVDDDIDIIEYENDIDALAKDFPDAYQVGYNRLIKMIESGELPVEIPPKRKLTPRSLSLLKKITVRTEVLYNLGVWREHVDSFSLNFDIEKGGGYGGIAIALHTDLISLDENGHYVDEFSYQHIRKDLPNKREAVWEAVSRGVSATEKALIKVYRYAAVVEAYSDILGYDFHGRMNVVVSEIESVVEFFNSYLNKTLRDFSPVYPWTKGPFPIKPENLKPTQETCERIKSKIDLDKPQTWEELLEGIEA